MKIVYFDMEFANGKVPGSIFSIGVLETNSFFHILKKSEDILLNPDCKWDLYVLEHFLSYPRALIESQPVFSEKYEQVKKMLEGADLVVGYSSGNDIRALNADCIRYGLPPILFRCLDLEKLWKSLPDYPEVKGGLFASVTSLTGKEPEHQHRSDGDAYATMLLLRAICKKEKQSVSKLISNHPDALNLSSDFSANKEEKKKKPRKYYRHFSHKNKQSNDKKSNEK